MEEKKEKYSEKILFSFFFSFLSCFLWFLFFHFLSLSFFFLLKHAAILKERLAKHGGGSRISMGGGGGGGGAQKVLFQHANYERETELTFGRGPGARLWALEALRLF